MGNYYSNDNASKEDSTVHNKFYGTEKGIKAWNKEYLKAKKSEILSLTANLRLRNQEH